MVRAAADRQIQAMSGPLVLSYFYPTLVRGLGYTAITAQYMTVSYVVGKERQKTVADAV